jgi:hypothetical protein
MALRNMEIRYRITSATFTEQAVRNEFAGIQTNSAFQKESNEISGIIPEGLLGGTIKYFVITDDKVVWRNETNDARLKEDVPAQGVLNAGNTGYVIYLNPLQDFPNPNNNNLPITVAELLAHEFGHATDKGLKALAHDVSVRQQDPNRQSETAEDVAVMYEEQFDQAVVPPIKKGPRNLTAVTHPTGKPGAYLYLPRH